MSFKTLLLSSVLGAVLFAGVVATSDAFSRPRPKASSLATDKQGSWLSRHWRAAVFAVGLSSVGIAGLWVVQEELARVQINKTATAQYLAYNLSNEWRKLVREEEDRIVYYVKDGEARIGWLTDKKDFIGERVLPYNHYNREGLSIGTKIGFLADRLPFLSNKDVLSKEAIKGKLLPSAYPMYNIAFSNEEGQVVSGHVFARIIPLEAKEETDPDTYVALVTHHDKQELADDDKYFALVPNDQNGKYGPPLISVSHASSTLGDGDGQTFQLELLGPEYSSHSD